MMPFLQALKQNSRSLCTAAVLLAASWALTGCATGPNAHPRDPLEPLNRGVYRFNDAVDKAVLKPTATAYTKITPTFVQKGVRNFFSNLGDAWSTVNSILQLKGQDAANSFSRLTVNTVFGLGGIFDVATEARIPQSKQDFGLTLGRWGVPSGPYVVLPLMGPSTLRDTAALPIDMKGNPVGAVSHVGARNALSALSVVDYRAQMLQASDLLDQAALDPYILLRDAYLQQRDARAGQARPGHQAAQATGGDGYEPPLMEDGAAPDGNAQAVDTAGAGYEPPLENDQEAVPATRTGHAGSAAVPTVPTMLQAKEQGMSQTADRQPQAEPASGQTAMTPASTEAAEPVAKPKREATSTLRGNDELEPKTQQSPVVPAVSGQTPHYWPAVPKWVDEVAPNSMGGSFWRR